MKLFIPLPWNLYLPSEPVQILFNVLKFLKEFIKNLEFSEDSFEGFSVFLAVLDLSDKIRSVHWNAKMCL